MVRRPYNEKMEVTSQAMVPQGDIVKHMRPSQSNSNNALDNSRVGKGTIPQVVKGKCLLETNCGVDLADEAPRTPEDPGEESNISATNVDNHSSPTAAKLVDEDSVPSQTHKTSKPTPNTLSNEEEGTLSNEQDPYHDPLPIPHVSPPINVYRHGTSVIPSEHHDRYPQVVRLFRENTLQDRRLMGGAKHINYGLKLCGSSTETARPSILVFCRPQEFKPLRRLLSQDHLTAQYLLKENRRNFLDVLRNQDNEKKQHRPLFRIYFWRTSRPMTLLGELSYGAHVCFGNQSATASSNPPDIYDRSLTLCATRIYTFSGFSQVSTLGCVLKMGQDYYGLTAGHGIRSHTNHHLHNQEPSYKARWESNEIINSLSKEEASTASAFDDDILYESLADEEDSDDYDNINSEIETCDRESIGFCQYELRYADAKDDRKSERAMKRGAPIKPPADPSRRMNIDLDWGLIKLTKPEQLRPNLFFNPSSNPPVLTAMSPVPAALPKTETEILIILPSRIVKRGKIQPSMAFLGGINSCKPSEVGCLVLDNNQRRSLGISFKHIPNLGT